jgi:transposase
MQTVTTIGFDIAKSVFQVHGVNAAGQVCFTRYARAEAALKHPNREEEVRWIGVPS